MKYTVIRVSAVSYTHLDVYKRQVEETSSTIHVKLGVFLQKNVSLDDMLPPRQILILNFICSVINTSFKYILSTIKLSVLRNGHVYFL